MSDPVKKLDPEIIVLEDANLDEIDRALFGDNLSLEKTSIQIKIPTPPESALVRKIIGDANAWAHQTLIVEQPTEIESENPYVIEFKTGIYNVIATTYLASAWEDLAQPLNEETRASLEHTRRYAIQYSYILGNYKYSNYIDQSSINQIIEALTSGDWFSEEGLLEIQRKIRIVLRILT